MLRDFKFLRRNSGKNSNAEEIENVPINPRYSLGNQTGTDSNRAPLNAIQEPASNSKAVVEKEVGVRSTKVDKTPTKVKRKSSDNTMSLSTPEKQGAQAKSRFGWVPKNESSSNAIESHDDGRADMSHYMSQSTRVIGNGVFASMTTPQSNRVMGRANSGYSECNSTQSTPTKSVTKPPNPGLCLTGGSRPLSNGGARMGNFAALSKGIPISCSSSTVVNSVEVPHFDLKEDPSFWMDHNVQVLIRVRPLNSKEKSTNAYSRCLKQESAQCITWIGQPETRFTFDHVACETIDQETLFRMVGLPMVENCLSGYNSCVFAYGQTGSGKTYTMLGEIEELEVKPSPNRGMTPRIFEFLFARIRAEEESRRDERLKYNCKCSFLEIYNEQITDLLDPSSANLLLREDIKTGVYVENLSEFEVQTVGDILKLLSQGSSNRKVAATNMNRESSRSHSVFTCVIERRWEKDSTSNLRFARLNLVDLAGSERQKTSGAEGERLKEAANINKSLSTLGHVIMVLLDVAHGRTKHVPYRDSRLTFLLQDSLGGNSKTMMIANVSPSICCAAETLNTLKFAQRAKLIQNNAVVNEDSSGDVIALQHQIQVLKEELSALKRQNVSRSLSFGENPSSQKAIELDEQRTDNLLGSESKGILKLSLKQLKSLETTLAGALRREQMAETSIKQLEAELEQLNRLVRQREEDTRCTKMMLKFREDKIQRMESLVSGLIPADAYLLEENGALSEEIQLLRAKLDRNPEVTRFALENIRLLEQIRRYQDFYEEGERELLLTEVSELRDQLALLLDGKSNQNNHPKISATPQEAIHFSKENEMLNLEFKSTLKELEECRSNLNSCLENNEKLSREIDDLRASLINLKTETCDDDSSVEVIKESIIEAPLFDNRSLVAVEKQKGETKHETLMKHTEEVINLQLELDILKIILKEERSSRGNTEQMRTWYLDRDLELTKEKVLLLTKQCEDVKEELKEAKSVIEALESQQVLSINEIEDLRNSNSHYVELLSKQELEISAMKEQMCFQELKDLPSFKHSENADSPLQAKLKKMQGSLEKAKRLNMWYQSDRTFQTSNEEEMDEVRKQVEAETAEVIVCLQEELATLQQQVQDSKLKERETRERLVLLQNELKELHEKLYLMAQDKKELGERLEEKDDELKLKELLQTDLKELQEKLYLMTLDKKELGEELQEELATLQQQVQDSKLKERETQERLVLLQNELKELHEKLYLMAQDKKELGERLEEKDDELKLKELLQTDLKELQEKLYLMTLDKKELGEELQEELATLQQQVQDSKLKERETQERLVLFQTELKELQEKFSLMAQDKKELGEKLEEKDDELKALSEEWEQLTSEIEDVLTGGSEALKDASNQLDVISGSFPRKRAWISEKVGRMTKIISEKELLIEELNQCLDDANNRRSNMECMLRSLRGAALVITEAHQQECSEKEQEILQLTSQLKAKASLVAKLEDKIKEEEEEIRKASTCATVAFLIVNRMSQINSDYHDALKHKDIQLRESIGMNLQKDAFLHNQATVIDEAETQIQTLKTELVVSEESLGKLKLQLLEEQKRACAMEQKLQEIEENDILKTREKLTELKFGVSTLRSCMNEYVEQVGSSENDNTPVNLACLPANGKCGARTGAEMNQGSNVIDSQTVEDLKTEISECTFEVCKNVSEYSLDHKNFAISGTNKDMNDRDATIILLRKEIESALECLKGVQSEMAKLRNEKEEVWMSAKQSRGSIEYLMTQILTLQTDMSNFEKQLVPKMVAIDHKLQKVGETVQEAGTCWCQKEELFELELGDAKVVAAQKTAEASCILAQFEEAQDTMKEADIMINELVISNETLKLEIEGLKKMEDSIINEKNILINEVQSLQSAKDLQDSHYKNLEDQFASDMMEMRRLVLELESIVGQVQTTFKEDSLSIASDFICMKSQLQDSTMLMRSWLEDIWSEIIVKDCAVSVLHLCHMGILLETVTGLNAENGLLHHGLCESASVISELREHNFKSRNELEMCRILKGKLLADIKNSFDLIARKEDETGELSIKLTTFEKKILNLQLQEELMLQRANNMGSELSVLTKELDMSNRNVLGRILNQEKLLKDKEEVLKSQEENFMIDLSAKDFELLILASELNHVEVQKASMEEEQISCCMVLENFKKAIIFLTMDAEIEKWIMMDEEVEIVVLQKKVQEAQRERQELLSKLNESNSRITHMDKVNKTLEQDIQLLKDVSCSNDHLQSELGEVIEEKMRLSSQVKKLEADCEKLIEVIKTKERALEISSSHISDLDLQKQMLHNDKCFLEASSCKLQAELEMKDAELSKMNYLEEENESMKSEVKKLKEDYFRIIQDLEEKKSECESSLSRIDVFGMENQRLQEKISSLETCTVALQAHLDMVNAELTELRLSQSVIAEELCLKGQNLQIHVDRVNTLKQENVLLRNGFKSHEKSKYEFLNSFSFNAAKGIDSVEAVDMVGTRIINALNEKSVPLEKMVEEICKSIDSTSKFIEEFESLENFTKELIAENTSLQTELSRKDDVLKGLLFDLSLLQESASNNMDQKDEIEELVTSLEALEDELAVRSHELDEAGAKSVTLEAQLKEKIEIISTLESDILKERESIKSLSSKNLELMANIEDALEAKRSTEEKLMERKKVNESLELELTELGTVLDQMKSSIESLRCNLDTITSERDDLQTEGNILKKKLEMAQALAEENEAIAMEAQQIAETRKLYAEDKEEEVRLLERSIEELDCTVNVLENKVDIVKGEAERQRLQREDLELELHAIKQQMQNVRSSDADIKRHLDEKEKKLQEALQHMQTLEREIAARDTEIAQCKVHISELNLHAEAQACEYKQKFKALETMAEQVKPEGPSTHLTNTSSNKLEKNGSKPRGSGSPFKCIGLGLVQQVKSERDEELTAGRLRIEELEALAASRQKEIFMLKARLASAESMTHDVIRDLLGLKLDMTSYASLVDNQQVQKITEKVQHCAVETDVKEKEVINMLKQQLNEFIEERKGWLEEIDRKQAEMVAAQIALEKLRQRDQLLTTENEMFKMENINHKKKIMELEAELKKLSGQQNLQQRIHHHAKIKEENNLLKVQNDNLSIKLQRTETILSRVKEELAHFRTANGRSPYINFDEEQWLNNKLKETEEERLQLAQKLLGLCTSILKAAGITRPASDVSLPAAEEALEQLRNRITLLERELQDMKFKNKITNERIRLSELMPQSSPVSSKEAGENRQTPNRISQTPFLSALDR